MPLDLILGLMLLTVVFAVVETKVDNKKRAKAQKDTEIFWSKKK